MKPASIQLKSLPEISPIQMKVTVGPGSDREIEALCATVGLRKHDVHEARWTQNPNDLFEGGAIVWNEFEDMAERNEIIRAVGAINSLQIETVRASID
jgi:hypothetical protein